MDYDEIKSREQEKDIEVIAKSTHLGEPENLKRKQTMHKEHLATWMEVPGRYESVESCIL
jgi:hypothetical protein